jgi:hypothetical protein
MLQVIALSTFKTDILQLIAAATDLASDLTSVSPWVVPTRDPTHFAGLYFPHWIVVFYERRNGPDDQLLLPPT